MKKSILNWLDDQANQGNELSIVWEGGGDSGWVHFEIDNESVENEYTEALVDYMNIHLNYGSWAGEFTANGRAIYDSETKCFEGVDYYGETEDANINSSIKISIPKKFWFDTFHVEVESYNDASPNVVVSFNVKNGFLIKEHEDFCRNLEEELVKDFEDLFNDYEREHDLDNFSSCTEAWILDRKASFEEDGDNLIFLIDNVQILVNKEDERSVVMEVTNEMIEIIDESLN